MFDSASLMQSVSALRSVTNGDRMSLMAMVSGSPLSPFGRNILPNSSTTSKSQLVYPPKCVGEALVGGEYRQLRRRRVRTAGRCATSAFHSGENERDVKRRNCVVIVGHPSRGLLTAQAWKAYLRIERYASTMSAFVLWTNAT